MRRGDHARGRGCIRFSRGSRPTCSSMDAEGRPGVGLQAVCGSQEAVEEISTDGTCLSPAGDTGGDPKAKLIEIPKLNAQDQAPFDRKATTGAEIGDALRDGDAHVCGRQLNGGRICELAKPTASGYFDQAVGDRCQSDRDSYVKN